MFLLISAWNNYFWHKFQVAKAPRQDPDSTNNTEAAASFKAPLSDPEDTNKKKEQIEAIKKDYEKAASSMSVDFETISSIVEGHKNNWDCVAHPRTIVNFVQKSQGLIINFLEKHQGFQSLGKADKTLLFNNNAHYFGMFLLANYFTAETGYEQLKGPKGLFSAFHLSVGRKLLFQWNIQYSSKSITPKKRFTLCHIWLCGELISCWEISLAIELIWGIFTWDLRTQLLNNTTVDYSKTKR